MSKLTIHNLAGQIIKNTKSVDVSAFISGIYFLQIETNIRIAQAIFQYSRYSKGIVKIVTNDF